MKLKQGRKWDEGIASQKKKNWQDAKEIIDLKVNRVRSCKGALKHLNVTMLKLGDRSLRTKSEPQISLFVVPNPL